MDFGGAPNALRAGASLTRFGWTGAGQFVPFQLSDAYSKRTLSYIYIMKVTGDTVPRLASQTDMLAEDWEITHAE